MDNAGGGPADTSTLELGWTEQLQLAAVTDGAPEQLQTSNLAAGLLLWMVFFGLAVLRSMWEGRKRAQTLVESSIGLRRLSPRRRRGEGVE